MSNGVWSRERTYGRFLVISIWQRYLGAGVTRGPEGGVCIPKHPKSSDIYKALDIDDLLFAGWGLDHIMYRKDKPGYTVVAGFEESTGDGDIKPGWFTKWVLSKFKRKAYVIQAPKPPTDLYYVFVKPQELDIWALEQSLTFQLADKSGDPWKMDFFEFEAWAAQAYKNLPK